MTREQAMMEKQIACAAGGKVDQEFARACAKAGIAVTDALVGSPLLNIHIAQKNRTAAYDRERWLKRKAARAA